MKDISEEKYEEVLIYKHLLMNCQDLLEMYKANEPPSIALINIAIMHIENALYPKE